MSRFDDSGMDRPNRNLVQRLAFRGKELIVDGVARFGLLSKWMFHIPEAEIEPRPGVWRALSLQAKQIADCPFKPYRRRMMCGDARKFSRFAGVTEHHDFGEALIK